MKNPLRTVFLVQILFFLGWAGLEEWRLHTTQTSGILLETLPVDPRDLLSGQYMDLRYQIADLSGKPGFYSGFENDYNQSLWVLLSPFTTPDGLIVYQAAEVTKRKPPKAPLKEFWVRCKLDSHGHAVYGIERWYFSEVRKEEINTRRAKKIFVKVIIAPDGQMRVKDLVWQK